MKGITATDLLQSVLALRALDVAITDFAVMQCRPVSFDCQAVGSWVWNADYELVSIGCGEFGQTD